jgi:patatin-like phospholipase/acyl hydrolase
LSYREREASPPPHRILALDGGGIRGVLTLKILEDVERTLQEALGRDNSFVLADWFDYMAGTSTGAIIAAGLSRGMRVSALQRLYDDLGADMFKKPILPRRLWFKYGAKPLQNELKRVFGDATLGDDSVRTLLMLVLRNASTDSPWPLANTTGAEYNRLDRPYPNLALPLWQLIRASAAAPVFFPAEIIQIGDRKFTFVDGGLTSYNNPAFQAFLMATLRAYGLNWPTGEDKLLVVSVGTGFNPNANENLKLSRRHILYNASNAPSALMFAASVQQDMLCRVFGKCIVGGSIDREVKTLHDERGALQDKLFTYMRYNAELSRGGLQQLELLDIDADAVSRLDSVHHVNDLRRIGEAVATRDVRREHYEPFL